MTELLRLEDFKKAQLRVARILAADEIAGADRLWKLTIDSGSGPKMIVAGIKKNYPQRECLVGKSIVVVDNLEPAIIRGVESKGMLLAAKDGDQFSLITVERPEIPPGSAVG